MLKLYYKRHEQRYNVQTSELKKWYLEHLNFVTVSLRHWNDAMSVMLFVDGELAAFMGGFISRGEGSFVVPRLSINEDFGFYSPGILLVNETARFMLDNTSYRILDLSLGTENYKYKMGGTEHYTKCFILSPNTSI